MFCTSISQDLLRNLLSAILTDALNYKEDKHIHAANTNPAERPIEANCGQTSPIQRLFLLLFFFYFGKALKCWIDYCGTLTCISLSLYLDADLLPCWLFRRSFFSSAWHFSRLSPLLLCSIWYFFKAA